MEEDGAQDRGEVKELLRTNTGLSVWRLCTPFRRLGSRGVGDIPR
jgi:hypothetical protein